MTNEKDLKAGKAAYNSANAAAQNMSKDAGVKGTKVPVDAITHVSRPGTGDPKTGTHTSEVHGLKTQVTCTCPQCGKATLHPEFPDQYETWLKCSSCGFFMGMSHDDWHRMENSPNISEKIKKMAGKQGKL